MLLLHFIISSSDVAELLIVIDITYVYGCMYVIVCCGFLGGGVFVEQPNAHARQELQFWIRNEPI